MTALERRLARKGSYLLLTHGEGYSTDDGRAVRRCDAERHMQLDLDFDACGATDPVHSLVGNNDGLFPGMSQTWIMESD
jgi:hypothetical protein